MPSSTAPDSSRDDRSRRCSPGRAHDRLLSLIKSCGLPLGNNTAGKSGREVYDTWMPGFMTRYCRPRKFMASCATEMVGFPADDGAFI